MVGADAVISAVAAMPHCDAGRGKEAFHPPDALNGRRGRRGLGVIEVGQSVDLLTIKDGVTLHVMEYRGRFPRLCPRWFRCG